jgi:hypothetical protein
MATADGARRVTRHGTGRLEPWWHEVPSRSLPARRQLGSHLAALKAGERLAFIDAHASEVAAAVLTAPGFLSGLSPAELGVVRQRIEARADPEVAKAKAETAKALQATEQGWRAAQKQISDRGGLDRPHDGVAQRAGTSV